ncbi:hypothetical protein CRI94_04470 [Longibacter salinarum]|uniref:Uncharacterized protein n=1 Tax=Longibacter salinarum TaxID=1850348 RepID=A0A2A8D0G7_9BACT|nr:hypothetical protein CRI94_04470 [Longibacter salinarum]
MDSRDKLAQTRIRFVRGSVSTLETTNRARPGETRSVFSTDAWPFAVSALAKIAGESGREPERPLNCHRLWVGESIDGEILPV